MFEYGIGLSAASTDKEIAIAKLAYLAGQSNIRSKIVEIINAHPNQAEVIAALRELAEESDSIH